MAIVKSKLLNQLKKNWPGFAHKDIKKLSEIILNEIKRALRRGNRLEIRGFGSMSVKIQKSSIRRNPRTGQKVAVPEKKVIRWRQSKEMFKKINKNED